MHEIFTIHQPLPLCPDTYVYDYHGLCVRSGSTSSIERSKPVQQLVEEEGGQKPWSATTVSQTTMKDVIISCSDHNTAHIKEVCITLICAYVNILSVSLSGMMF